MSVSAFSGPLVTFIAGQYSGPANQNPDAGPAMICHGYALQDIRDKFSYKPGQNDTYPFYGFLSTDCLVVDQVPSAISTTNIAAGQHVTASTAMTLVSTTGSGITVGVSITNATTGAAVTVLAIDGAMGSVTFGSAASVNIWDPTKAISRAVSLTSTGNASAVNFTVAGYDIYGFPMTQLIAGPNNNTVTTTKTFKYIASVTPSGNFSAANISIGTSDVYGFPLRVDRLPYSTIWWNTTQNTGSSGTFVAADTTNPATTSTGDVRGTWTPPSASDGTKRLMIFVAPTVANIASTTGLFGITQD